MQENHDRSREVWVAYYKKHTGKAGLNYRESVEVAICFGWIDGLKKRVDDERYAHRFSPRKPKSKWTAANIAIAEDMIAKNNMAPAGQAAFEQRQTYTEAFNKPPAQRPEHLPRDMQDQLKEHPEAWQFFNELSPGYRREYVLWLTTAKREETRQRRLKEAIELLGNHRKLGMK